MVYMYHSFLIHSSADGHLGCFHVLAMINSAAMNIRVHVSQKVMFYGISTYKYYLQIFRNLKLWSSAILS